MQVEEAALRRTVSKNIAAYRKAHKDTQMDLAAKLNYSDKSISKWERGESARHLYPHAHRRPLRHHGQQPHR